MRTSIAPASVPRPTLGERLASALRPEFTGDLIHIDPDNPVFARGRCQVTGCDRGAWTKMLCNTHYGRWSKPRSPTPSSAATTNAPSG